LRKVAGYELIEPTKYHRTITLAFVSTGVLWASIAAPALAADQPASSPSTAAVDFSRDIQPLFQAHCTTCHGPDKQKSGLRLDERAAAFKGGDSGPVILPGKSAESRLLQLVAGLDPKIVMPAKGERLTTAEVSLLRAWIDQGAPWPEGVANARSRSSHWSLQPLRSSADIATQFFQNNTEGSRRGSGGRPKSSTKAARQGISSPAGNLIDAFVEARLASNNLALAPAADRATLIRRLSFDLIGLPPTPEEIDAFVADRSAEAWGRLVDRLLASPRYGERWGRHWLDVARFTESQGFEYDKLRDHAWHYRDYVIRSFNEDKPYDQFMREQIAGDVLEPVTSEGIIGASLLVCGPWDEAGNSQANVTQKAITREEELEDLISTVGQTFLGLTLNCARCHSHKFDPIPIEEYYRVKSVFDGVKHGERPFASAQEVRKREERKTALRQESASAQKEISDLEIIGWRAAIERRRTNAGDGVTPGQGTAPDARPAAPASSLAASGPPPAPILRWTFEGATNGGMTAGLRGGATIRTGRLQLPKEGAFFQSPPLERDIREKTLEAWVALADLQQGGGAPISIESDDGRVFDAIVFGERQPRKWVAGSGGFERTRDLDAPEETASPDALVHLAITYQADGRICVYRNGEPYGKDYTPSGAPVTYRAGKSRVLLGRRHTGGERPWLTGEIQQAALYDRALQADEVTAAFRAGGRVIPAAEILAALSEPQRVAHAAALARKKKADAALEGIPPLGMSYVGQRVQPAPTHVLKRGDVRSPGDVVTPGGLGALVDLKAEFGLAAEAPEGERRRNFADWLAHPHNPLPARVMANRVWQLHFGQGLVGTANDFGAAGARPTHPELLDWLAARLREDGWSVKALHRLIVNSRVYRQSSEVRGRGAVIDADNQLLWRFTPRRLEAEAVRDAVLAVSGQINLELGGPSFRPFDALKFPANAYVPVDKIGPDYNRRTVYRMNVNSGKEPLLDAFDCPDPSVKTPRRGVTTTPLQALALMNNAFIQRQAGHFAARALQDSSGDLAGAIRRSYRLALGRPPTSDEARRALAAARERSLTNVCWVLLNSTEFVYAR
jgi:mono/diheme cytochrome c family protein